MSDPFLGEIRIFAGNFAPRYWAYCDGQLIPVSQNDALFSLLGTQYGGDGRTTFALPDMRGRIPVHMGTGAGLTPRHIGSSFGTEQETLTVMELAQHSHSLMCTPENGSSTSPVGKVYGGVTDAEFEFYGTQEGDSAQLAEDVMTEAGGSQAHTNIMPYNCINFIICTNGIYPSRN